MDLQAFLDAITWARLRHVEFRVLAALATLVQDDQGTVPVMTRREVQRRAQCSKNSVTPTLEQLARAGWITTREDGTPASIRMPRLRLVAGAKSQKWDAPAPAESQKWDSTVDKPVSSEADQSHFWDEPGENSGETAAPPPWSQKWDSAGDNSGDKSPPSRARDSSSRSSSKSSDQQQQLAHAREAGWPSEDLAVLMAGKVDGDVQGALQLDRRDRVLVERLLAEFGEGTCCAVVHGQFRQVASPVPWLNRVLTDSEARERLERLGHGWRHHLARIRLEAGEVPQLQDRKLAVEGHYPCSACNARGCAHCHGGGDSLGWRRPPAGHAPCPDCSTLLQLLDLRGAALHPETIRRPRDPVCSRCRDRGYVPSQEASA